MATVRVLVTGAGSGVGQGIIKSLRAGASPKTIISADINPFNCGLYRADEGVLLPRVEDPGALETIVARLKSMKADAVLVGSEFDLTFFARHKAEIERATGALVVASPLRTVEIADDKWLTAKFLEENGLPFPRSHLATDVEDAARTAAAWGYPLVLKTRTGTSARHVHFIHDEAELRGLYASVPKPMLQRMLDLPSSRLQNEYTCSVFKCSDGTLLGPFTARRTLRGGSSWVVEVAEFKELHPLMLLIGAKMEIMGSMNVQLIVGKDGPVPIEFNARFSGTTAVRAHFGFNEPEMALQEYLFHRRPENPAIREGLAFRYLEEVFVEGVRADELAEPLPKGVVRPWF